MPGKPTIVAAVRRDLALLDKAVPGISKSARAAVALNLAGRIDDAETSAHAAAIAAKELRETMERLGALAPPVEQKDGLDELNARRMARRATA